MTGRAIRRVAGLLIVVGLAGGTHLAQARWMQARIAQAGAQLFEGALTGSAEAAHTASSEVAAPPASMPIARLRGHTVALPAAAARCANCHQDPAGRGPAQAFGGRLDAQRLLAERPRRGGPAVAYGEAGFCRLLRDGIDPNDMIVDAAMPRYAIDDAQCRALWQHLTGDA